MLARQLDRIFRLEKYRTAETQADGSDGISHCCQNRETCRPYQKFPPRCSFAVFHEKSPSTLSPVSQP